MSLPTKVALFLALIICLVVIGLIFVPSTSSGWWLAKQLLSWAPKEMPKVPTNIDNTPLKEPSIRLSVSEKLFRAAVDRLVGDELDLVVAHGTDALPRTAIVRIEKIRVLEFTDAGTIHVDLQARPMYLSWFSTNVDIDRIEASLIPSVWQDKDGTYWLRLVPIVTDFRFGQFTNGGPGLLTSALERLIAKAITENPKSVMNVPIPLAVMSFAVELPKYHSNKFTLDTVRVTTEGHSLVVAARLKRAPT